MIDNLFCAQCGTGVGDPLLHVQNALHDRFFVRLTSGLRVDVGDAGASLALVAREKKAHETNVREAEQAWREGRERTHVMLQGARDGLASSRVAIVAADQELEAIRESLAAIGGALPSLRAAAKRAEREIPAARRRVVAEVAEWVRSGAVHASLQQHCVETHVDTLRPQEAAWSARRAVREAERQQDGLLNQQLFLLRHRASLLQELPEMEHRLACLEKHEEWERSEDVRRVGRRFIAPYELEPIEGRALRQARRARSRAAILARFSGPR